MGEIAKGKRIDKRALSVRLCQWADRHLHFVLQNLAISEDFAREANARIEARIGGETVAAFDCDFTCALGGLWGCAIDCRVLCATLDDLSIATITMELVLSNGATELRSEPIHRLDQHPQAFAEFISGYYLDDNLILIPDEDEHGIYAIRAIGWKADATKQSFARSKKDRSSKNLILLEALAKGPGIAHTLALAFDEPSNEPVVSIDKKGRPWAVFASLDKKLKFNLAHARGMSKDVTLLDDGKKLSKCVAYHWVEDELEILKKPLPPFLDLCETHGIEYIAGFGTLLGAVRHKGVIPWDHDVDFFMTQGNYLKLRDLFDSGRAPEYLRLDDWMSVPGYPGPLGRLIDARGVKLNIRNAYGHADIGSFGIAFDIFPLIGVSGTREDAERMRARAIAFWEMENRIARSKLIRTNAVIDEYKKLEKRCEADGRESALSDIRDELYGTRDEDADYYIVGVAGQRNSYIFERDWIHPLVNLPFDEGTMPCPHDYLKVLRELYGPNFRKYPKGKERIPKRYSHLRSLDLPYETVRQTYLEDADTSRELENRSALKDLRMQEAVIRCPETKAMGEISAAFFASSISEKLGSLDLSKRAKGDYAEIDAACAGFIRTQLRDKPLTWRIPLKIDQQHLAIALESLLCFRGESGDAAQILSIRFDNTDNEDEAVAPSLQRIYDAVWNTIEMRDCYEYGNTDKAAELAQRVLDNYPFAIEARCLQIAIALDSKTDPSWFESTNRELENITNRSSSLLPLALQTALLFKAGHVATAVSFQRMLERDFDDGMVIGYLNELMKEACSHGN